MIRLIASVPSAVAMMICSGGMGTSGSAERRGRGVPGGATETRIALPVPSGKRHRPAGVPQAGRGLRAVLTLIGGADIPVCPDPWQTGMSAPPPKRRRSPRQAVAVLVDPRERAGDV